MYGQADGGDQLGGSVAAGDGVLHRGRGAAGEGRADLPTALRGGAGGEGPTRLPGAGAEEALAAAAAQARAVGRRTGGWRRAGDDDVGAGVAVAAGHRRVGARGVAGDVGEGLADDAVGRVGDGAVGEGVDVEVDRLVEAAETGDQGAQPLLGGGEFLA